MAFIAPRILKEPVVCKHSALKKTSRWIPASLAISFYSSLVRILRKKNTFHWLNQGNFVSPVLRTVATEFYIKNVHIGKAEWISWLKQGRSFSRRHHVKIDRNSRCTCARYEWYATVQIRIFFFRVRLPLNIFLLAPEACCYDSKGGQKCPHINFSSRANIQMRCRWSLRCRMRVLR